MMAAHSVTINEILSEATRIYKAQPGHFNALFFLLVLPLSFVSVVYRFLLQPTLLIPYYNQFISFFLNADPEIPQINEPYLVNLALYFLLALLFTLSTSASIAYSTFHGFHGKRVKLSSSLKSCLSSFFPLLATYIASRLILGSAILAIGGFTVLAFNSLSRFGVEIDRESGYFTFYATLIGALVPGFVLYCEGEWYLANMGVVAESLWGFAALKRSSVLVKGMRRIAFPMVFFYGSLLGLLPHFPPLKLNDDPVTWEMVLVTILFSILMAAIMAHSVAANAVLFMYCKALHGEYDRDGR